MRRRGLILPVALVLIGLLALTMAGYVFFIRAETRGTVAVADAQQMYLASISGFEELVAALRQSRDDVGVWFNNPTRWRHALVYSPAFDRSKDPFAEGRSRAEAFDSGEALQPAIRYSVVALNYNTAEKTIRYGITPESTKLNINTAGDDQLRALIMPLLLKLGVENAPEIVDAILDWRDQDDEQRGGGAENAYYNALTPPYNCKNAPFTTIEELLLVKGVNAGMLYGEDVNRNGLLEANEDDGDATFPYYDNADGVLDLGIAPYLTAWSREPDTALDNKPRINMNLDAAAIQAQIAQQLPNGELSDATIQFIVSVKSQGIPLRSPADLFPGSGIDAAQPPGSQPPPPPPPTLPPGMQPGGQDSGGGEEAKPNDEPPPDDGGTAGGGKETDKPDDTQPDEKPPPEKQRQRQQSRGGKVDDADPNPIKTEDPQGSGDDDGKSGLAGDPVEEMQQTPPVDDGAQAPQAPGGVQDARLLNSPVTLEELPYIMDRFTTHSPRGAEGIPGLININTAPLEVLLTLPGITPDAAAALVAGRASLDATALRTTAWPVMSQAIDVDTWQRIAPFITTKSHVFHIEVIGYGDTTKIARRIEWIVEMIGPLAQVRYQRDLTALGISWPLDDDTVLVTR